MSDLSQLASSVLEACANRGVMLATAESCTGGLIAAALTEIPGSSAVFDRGFVTYSNSSKVEMLGVLAETLAELGAVSGETALEMANGALARSRAEVAISVTGIAGPGGGSADKPVGLVWFGVAVNGKLATAQSRRFDAGSRAAIRDQAVRAGLQIVLAALTDKGTSFAAP